jgi:isopentenyl phosphate kinase
VKKTIKNRKFLLCVNGKGEIMNGLHIVKIGGSIITDKTKPLTFKKAVVKRLAREIKKSNEEIILVHGAGSFGHIFADRYKLHEGYKNDEQIEGVVNMLILNTLIDAGINAVSISPSAIVKCRDKKIVEMETKLFKDYLGMGIMPVTFGDVVLDKKLKFCICSGDQLMLHLAKKFKPEKVIFCTDVDGIFTFDPSVDKNARLLENADTNILKSMLKMGKSKSEKIDITGEMFGKINTIMEISKIGVGSIVLNGNKKNRLKGALTGQAVKCTRIGGIKGE